jgi:hypothetical protein
MRRSDRWLMNIEVFRGDSIVEGIVWKLEESFRPGGSSS